MKQNHAEKYNPSNITVIDINFELMNKTYFLPLCRFSEKFIHQDTEDIVQDIFETMWEKRDSIYIKGTLNSYLYRSVRNKCLDSKKHENVKRGYSEYVLDNSDSLSIQDYNNPQSILESQEREHEIDQAIDALPEQEGKVFRLWLEGFSYQEIAEKLGKSINTVDVQIRRAKNKFSKMLDNKR